jgi:endonuclease III
VDAPTLRCSRRLGLLDSGEETPAAIRATLEHLIPKSKGPVFSDLIATIAEEFCWEDSPRCNACPLSGSCQAYQEGAFTNGTAKRGAGKPKPR